MLCQPEKQPENSGVYTCMYVFKQVHDLPVRYVCWYVCWPQVITYLDSRAAIALYTHAGVSWLDIEHAKRQTYMLGLP